MALSPILPFIIPSLPMGILCLCCICVASVLYLCCICVAAVLHLCCICVACMMHVCLIFFYFVLSCTRSSESPSPPTTIRARSSQVSALQRTTHTINHRRPSATCPSATCRATHGRCRVHDSVHSRKHQARSAQNIQHAIRPIRQPLAPVGRRPCYRP